MAKCPYLIGGIFFYCKVFRNYIFKAKKKNLTKEIQTCIHSSTLVVLNTYFSTTTGWSFPESDFNL